MGAYLKIIIRECETLDYVDIVLLNKNEMGYDYPVKDTKKQFERLLSVSDHKIYVAVVDDKVMGYIHANNYDLLYAPHLKLLWVLPFHLILEKRVLGKCF